MSREQLLADVRALRHHLGELIPKDLLEGNSQIANVLSSIEGIAKNIPPEPEAIKRLLHYSWEDIEYQHGGLTDTEQSLITEDEFNALVRWIK